MENHVTPPAVQAPTLELLAWVSRCPRTYPETMEVWRSSCPRLSVWEDALEEGLVAVVRAPGGKRSRATVTERGRAALDGA